MPQTISATDVDRRGASVVALRAITVGVILIVVNAHWIAQPSNAAGAAMATGFGFTLLLSVLRMRFLWWPFHPIGYVIGTGTWGDMMYILLPVLIGWALKLMVLKASGLQGIQESHTILHRARPRRLRTGRGVGPAGSDAQNTDVPNLAELMTGTRPPQVTTSGSGRSVPFRSRESQAGRTVTDGCTWGNLGEATLSKRRVAVGTRKGCSPAPELNGRNQRQAARMCGSQYILLDSSEI